MADKQHKPTFWRRLPWVAPVTALALAAIAAGLGQVAQTHILAQPEHAITFVIEDGLPYGITQESVEAVAPAYSYEPFTVMVVERELTWDEYDQGELPAGVDVMMSVGFDEEDIDLVLPDTRRVAVAKLADLDDWMPYHRAASDIRETLVNNLSQGQGPSAVVGAATTAAISEFDGGERSPVFWISIALIPLLFAILIMVLWARDLARERARKRAFSRARLRLARVVLELDLLEARVLIAGAALDRAKDKSARKVTAGIKRELTSELSEIRRDSLALAHEEQVLTRAILDPRAPVHERGKPTEAMPLDEFVARADALWRRTNALIAASSLRVGHTGGGDILGQVALATTLALDEILKRSDRITSHEIKTLGHHRSDLLALVNEAESAFGNDSTPAAIVAHADLMRRWQQVEQHIITTLKRIDKRLGRQAGRSLTAKITATAIAGRMKNRAQAASGGTLSNMSELRASLDLANSDATMPTHHAERVLLLLEAIDGSAVQTEPSNKFVVWTRQLNAESAGIAVAVVVPIAVALISGSVAVATMEASDKTYGRPLTGTEPLASLSIYGDPALLPEYAGDAAPVDRPANIDTLTLDYVRDRMESHTSSTDAALLPERVDLIVALLPLEDYVESRPHDEFEDTIRIDYLDLLDTYPRIKSDIAASYPDAIDDVTGDVRPGYAILPIWIAQDDTLGAGLPLTGTLSTGVDSRLGAYYFIASEPRMFNQPDGTSSVDVGGVVASRMTDLGREMEYNNFRKQTLPPSALFWTVTIATWTAAQVLVIAGWSLAQLVRRGAGTRKARGALRELKQELNKLALGLDLSMLDTVAVLGSTDGHGGKAAEADQRLYEMMLLTAWREVQELESLPRRQQRGAEWRNRVERMHTVIASLSERETAVAERALELIRTYS
ncbi:hypothetical protein ACQUSY_00675 [Microbacterium sp. YY-03]|uniref:hypothetical protein n=1 Tax=Microbacterium sp. YY-03 TaxID=3421636 RepID=UPI003D17B530